jgi:hypothetical protein
MVFSQSTVFCCGGGHAWVYGTQAPPSEVHPAVLPSSALGASPDSSSGVGAAVWVVQPSARSAASENRSPRIPKGYLQTPDVAIERARRQDDACVTDLE